MVYLLMNIAKGILKEISKWQSNIVKQPEDEDLSKNKI